MDEDIEFDTDDEEEIDDDLNMVLRSSLELLQHQHNNTIQELEVLKQQQHNYIEENSALKAKVLTLTNIIQQLQRQLQSSNTVGVTRQRVLKVVEDIAVKYIDYHSWDIGTRSKINNLIKSGHLDGLREIIQKEHAELDQDHRFAKDLMTDNQLYSFVYRLTNEYREKSKRKTLEKLAKKKAILDKIIDDLERNAQFLNPNQAAYVIQCIFVSHFVVFHWFVIVSYMYPTLLYIRMLPVCTQILQKQRVRCSPQYSCKSKSLGMLV